MHSQIKCHYTKCCSVSISWVLRHKSKQTTLLCVQETSNKTLFAKKNKKVRLGKKKNCHKKKGKKLSEKKVFNFLS